jgi:hypothetical protein
MIKILYLNGRYNPVLVCDHCDKRIEDAELALAVNVRPKGDKDETLDCYHVHKGDCDRSLERKLGQVGTIELTTHLVHLTHNSGLTPSDLKKESDKLEKFPL